MKKSTKVIHKIKETWKKKITREREREREREMGGIAFKWQLDYNENLLQIWEFWSLLKLSCEHT